VNQYGNFTIKGPGNKDYNLDGQLTLGENLADNGGIKMSFRVWQSRAKSDPNGKKYVFFCLLRLSVRTGRQKDKDNNVHSFFRSNHNFLFFKIFSLTTGSRTTSSQAWTNIPPNSCSSSPTVVCGATRCAPKLSLTSSGQTLIPLPSGVLTVLPRTHLISQRPSSARQAAL
jgi:hypothetical protein